MALPPLDTAVLNAPTLAAFWAAIAAQRPQWLDPDIAALVADTPLGNSALTDVTVGGSDDPFLIKATLDPSAVALMGLQIDDPIQITIKEN
jgi:hypothetical protein